MILAYIAKNPGCDVKEIFAHGRWNQRTTLHQLLRRMVERKEVVVRKANKNRNTYYPVIEVMPEEKTLGKVREIVSVFHYA